MRLLSRRPARNDDNTSIQCAQTRREKNEGGGQVIANTPRRFEWVLNGLDIGPARDFDIDLLRDKSAALVPTRGSLVAGWTLLIPRHSTLSFAAMTARDRADVLALREKVALGLSAFSQSIAWFEHGPSTAGSPVGCGVDQAHLHAVPLSFDLVAETFSTEGKSEWVEVGASDPFANVDPSRDYYYVGQGGRHFIHYPHKKVSQFFRRLIAAKIGTPARWNYNDDDGRPQARLTVARFENCAS